MRHLLLFAHNLGFILWLGGSAASLLAGSLLRQRSGGKLEASLELEERLLRALVLPGAVLVVLTGLVLTLRLYGSATSASGFPIPLMVMQGAGLLGAVLILVVSVPTMSRLSRLDPAGPHAPLVESLRRRLSVTGLVAGALGVVALLGGVSIR